MMEELQIRLEIHRNNAVKNYRENGSSDFDAGVAEGIKQALEILNDLALEDDPSWVR